MQSSSQIITTNKPTPSFFTGRMPFVSPNQQCQSTEGNLIIMPIITAVKPQKPFSSSTRLAHAARLRFFLQKCAI